jgi:16S rRNA (cytosine967-C5)-methyltransferase
VLTCRVSRYHSYLNSAKEILSLYNGDEPFSSFLKKYFSQNKKFGSRDRKDVANLCYCYFRAAPHPVGVVSKPIETNDVQLLSYLFLCSTEPNDILAALIPEWNNRIHLPLKEKMASFNYQLSSLFPWKKELSDGIEHEKFCSSFFVQPDLFLRIRPGHAENVLLKLGESAVEFEFISPFTIRLPNTFKADKLFDLDKEVVVQDYISQQISGFIPSRPGQPDLVWDSCAGSGGKSIMTYDLNESIDLTVSDVRESILSNLKKRFERAGIKKFRSLLLDMGNGNSQQSIINNPRLPGGQEYSIIIADVPCTGSGTWGRTPEQLYFFDKKKIDEYATKQKKIVSNVVLHLKPGGHLLYITCSVFKKENEEMADYLKKEFHLQVEKMELLKGYELKADTMFATLLLKPL